MKTVYIDGYFFDYEPLGGISRMWHELIKNVLLLSEDIRFVIGVKDDTENIFLNNLKKIIPESDARLTFIRGGKSLFSSSKVINEFGPIRAWSNYRKLVSDKTKVDIFHSSYASTILPDIKSISKVVTVHDLIMQKFSSLVAAPIKTRFHCWRHKITENYAIKKADFLIAVSQSTKNDLIEYFGLNEDRIKVIHHGISEHWFPAQDRDEVCPNPYFLFVGGRNPYKNYDTVLKTLAKLNGKYKEIKLITVGYNKHSLQVEPKKYAELNIADRVIDLGIVDDDKLKQLYTNAIAFIFPSIYEGFGFPLLESLACKCPVIASEIPTNREIGGSFVNYFNATDSNELVDKMMDIYNNPPGEAERMQYSTYAHTYTWENAARKLLEVYRTLT